ncbi:hypothetical protein FAM22277_00119 [Lacticaseibacillus paracasei]|jgi:hypothetical protein|uniref:hypothetical protein n=1 Tax=Lacticaseibacillus paracasei TaxID=1597 RepID=UPI000F0B4EE0|nr:hypothetical protein [Lacticaseibacillus paracasei]RNE04886.1 hypothetical protein FAM22277_00119 [Lacticaseibacillus paracasei]
MTKRTHESNNQAAMDVLLKAIKNTDLQELIDLAFNDSDQAKQDMLLALYHYVLNTRQQEAMNQKHFTI